jgi:hypothetical protein
MYDLDDDCIDEVIKEDNLESDDQIYETNLNKFKIKT